MSSYLLLRSLDKLSKNGKIFGINGVYGVAYSRRHPYNSDSSYVTVKSNRGLNASDSSGNDHMANWELLAPKGFKFLLPGGIGPAVSKFGNKKAKNLNVEVQKCPTLLRDAVIELFPKEMITKNIELTVVTLKQSGPASTDHETIAKEFLQAAETICSELSRHGYWADFINPFSGRPHLGAFNSSTLYNTDQRFRCLGFEVKKRKMCIVVQSKETVKKFKLESEEATEDELQNNNFMTIAEFEKPSKFIGNLFTDAPLRFHYLVQIVTDKYV